MKSAGEQASDTPVAGYPQNPVVFNRLGERGYGADQRGNAVQGTLLGELGWSPNHLAERSTGLLGPSYVARSTVSDWLHRRGGTTCWAPG
ncbi:MAG: hypothetical protein ACRDRA_04990 [Pseudonocardiaceae bacterium]